MTTLREAVDAALTEAGARDLEAAHMIVKDNVYAVADGVVVTIDGRPLTIDRADELVDLVRHARPDLFKPAPDPANLTARMVARNLSSPELGSAKSWVQRTIEYALTIDTAKHITMSEYRAAQSTRPEMPAWTADQLSAASVTELMRRANHGDAASLEVLRQRRGTA